ncbi:Post-GPI attachment to proteins factor 2 [Camponotus floridanus]|uniref:Post-GPI attachment to proteins factor 2 n=1 Tax=Camponotus floridanus TaxID=104421 RepID=E2A9B7_CAMFO|nr:post-GPI attachment to proteins factor 2 [Camponotus floridanus]EFN69959.1 Post-GPI attachment to proteins factor 2 [Camponotus floridanus]
MSKLRLGSDYIPLTSEEDMSKIRVVVPFSKVAWLTVSLPFLAFVFCVAWSVLHNFEHATSTHCQVYNFLPSVSAAIGHYRPQRDVWKTAIALQATVRIIVFMMYYRYYREHVYIWARHLSNVALVMYTVENTSLVTLSFWTSDENYTFHKMSFIMFLITSFIHMFLAYYIMRNCLNVAKDFHDTSLKWKWRSMMLNVFSIFIACYFFYRHNKYCEPFVYSMFALSEYGVVISNMGYHLTAALDFATTRFMISGNRLRII